MATGMEPNRNPKRIVVQGLFGFGQSTFFGDIKLVSSGAAPGLSDFTQTRSNFF